MKLNGELVEEPIQLQHGDRILIGDYHYYLYVDPLVDYDASYEWEAAMKEANKEQLQQFLGNDDDYNRQLAEMEEKIRKEQEDKQRELEEQKQRLEQERQAQLDELEKKKQEMMSAGQDKEETMRKLEQQQLEFEKQMKEQE